MLRACQSILSYYLKLLINNSDFSDTFLLQSYLSKLIILFQILCKIIMLTKILEFHSSTENLVFISTPILHLTKDTYEDYLAFLFQSNQEINSDNHVIYLQKAAFDGVLQNFQDEELLYLQQKQDMYLSYIMHSIFKITGIVTQEEFEQNLFNLYQYYLTTEDEKIFIDKIQRIVKAQLNNKTSPFTYLQVCKDLFSEKLRSKLRDILKFMIGGSLCYKMAPASIFGICLKWTMDRFGIKNNIINELINHLIDLSDPETLEKIQELKQMMSQIFNMKSSS